MSTNVVLVAAIVVLVACGTTLVLERSLTRILVGFVMLGKTFKGLTDAMLAWQTDALLALATERDGHVVHVRPELVVEIAFDGVQRSTRYPGGVALRFARVLRHRPDKRAEEADTLSAVLAHQPSP